MKKTLHAAMLALLFMAPQKEQVWTANIDQIRQTARMIPGTAPLRINVLKFAESRRTKNFSVKGAPAEPSVQARTVFQIVYADGYVMVDSGMDQQVHNFYGRGVVEPYDAEAARQVERAVRGARSILITHEHGDHIIGLPVLMKCYAIPVITAPETFAALERSLAYETWHFMHMYVYLAMALVTLVGLIASGCLSFGG